MGNDRIKKMFDDIDGKVDFLIERCHTLQSENKELILKIRNVEAELNKKADTDELFSEQEALIQSKIDGLLTKLNYFSNSATGEYSSNL